MAAGSREIMCSLMKIDKPPTKSSSSYSLVNSLHYSSNRRLMQVRKLTITPMAAADLTKFESIVKASAKTPLQLVKVKALVTVKHETKELLKDIMFQWLDSDGHSSRRGVVLQLVSTELDPKLGKPKVSKESIFHWFGNVKVNAGKVTYKVEILVDADFGVPGAILVSNKYEKEFFLESIIIEGVVHFACKSWVQPDNVQAEKRVFFSNKAYLPNDTPVGLKEIREKDLRHLRGNAEGIRKLSDRIYDYDIYNDLGNPDKGDEYVRKILGGQDHPYPRRCRSGRPPANSDANVESPPNRYMPTYVPRDEAFEDLKIAAINGGRWKLMLRILFPMLKMAFTNSDAIRTFSEIKDLYKQTPPFGIKSKNEFWENSQFPRLNKMVKECIQDVFKFDPPKMAPRDIFSCCIRDDELGRRTLAGINPLSIERLKVFPPVSNLDPSIYGPQDSGLREEHIKCHLDGMSVQQALEEKKLFILDYHDIFFPFLNRINNHPYKKAYATRTIFLLTLSGSLKPIAIELSLPDKNHKRVLTPPVDSTTSWLWQLAKAHVCSNDAGAHQLIQHWLRVHACLEPFIIAAHRHLSVMHPIYKLLHPHMRYTMDVNAEGRKLLLNAGGVIEYHFSTTELSAEISASVYQNWWRFDMEGLPADLIRRGMAIPDKTQPHGLKLVVEDYPYANDGLLIWSAIEELVQAYVNYYYPDSSCIQSDSELNSWYHEFINVGHADICHANWWPKLSTQKDLVSILTTIIWVASAHHAAVNFGMYHYDGYFPVHPPFMRRLMPDEHDHYDNVSFLADPEGYFLASLPNLPQMLHYMSVLLILSTHSADEEYLGDRKDLSSWAGDPEILEAFYKFSIEMKRIEKEIEKRNADPKLRNRCGAGVSPYELLLPSSGPGATGRGVPNSASI